MDQRRSDWYRLLELVRTRQFQLELFPGLGLGGYGLELQSALEIMTRMVRVPSIIAPTSDYPRSSTALALQGPQL